MKRLYEAIQDWMVSYKRTSVKPTTYDRLLVSLDMLKRYPIANMPLEFLQCEDIQDYVNKLVDDGYALSAIKKQLHLIGGFIEHANLVGTLTRPLHKGVKLPSESAVQKHKKEVIAYNKSEQRALRQVFLGSGDPAYYAALIMMETGMRVGEVLALGWDDIDWRRKAVRICKTVVRITDKKRSYVQMGAKSHSSNRVIPLSSYAYELLENMRADDEHDSFVFHDKNGNMLTYETLRWRTKKACEMAGVPYYGQHVFRHTFATNCYERGCDVKLLSKLLGHSDVTITYNVYIHLFGDALEEMRSVVG